MNALKAKPTKEQARIAKLLELNIARDTGRVAAARILTAVANAIGQGHSTGQPKRHHRRQADELGLDISGDSAAVAAARIADELQRRNQEAFAKLNPKPGDRVRRVLLVEGKGQPIDLSVEGEITRIGKDMKIHLTVPGRRGKLYCWAAELERV